MDARGFSGARRVARRRPENASTGPTRQARRLGRRCQRGGRRCLGIGPIPCNGAASGLRDRRRRLQRRCQRGGRRCLANGPIPFNGAASGATGQTLRLVRRRRLRLCPGSTVTPTAIDSTRRPALAPPPHTNTRERLRITSNGADSRPPLTISGPAHEHTRTRADHCERLDITNNGRTAPDLTKTGQDHDSRTHANRSEPHENGSRSRLTNTQKRLNTRSQTDHEHRESGGKRHTEHTKNTETTNTKRQQNQPNKTGTNAQQGPEDRPRDRGRLATAGRGRPQTRPTRGRGPADRHGRAARRDTAETPATTRPAHPDRHGPAPCRPRPSRRNAAGHLVEVFFHFHATAWK